MGFLDNIRAPHSRSKSSRLAVNREGNQLKLEFKVEYVRVFSYASFWMMVAVARYMNNTYVAPRLLAGPSNGESCSEFDGVNGEEVDPPVMPGEGFDVRTQSHLNRAFGFNNVCTTWDYTPSREVTAMVYPLFEFSLILYLVLDFITVALYYQKGWVSKLYFNTSQALFVITIVLASWFRMIFVFIAYDATRFHTLAFVGLIVVLTIVACMNTWFVLSTRSAYKILGESREATARCAIAYLVPLLTISSFKLGLNIYAAIHGRYPSWALEEVFGMKLGKLIDNIWMVFNAVLPFFISLVRGTAEKPLVMVFDTGAPDWLDDGAVAEGEGEAIALRGAGGDYGTN